MKRLKYDKTLEKLQTTIMETFENNNEPTNNTASDFELTPWAQDGEICL